MGRNGIGMFVVAASLCARPATAHIKQVSVTGGRVEGALVDGVAAFKGIPIDDYFAGLREASGTR
jgi:hypothetical protein